MLPGGWVVALVMVMVMVVVGQWESSIECWSKVGAEINVACLHRGD